MSKFRKGIVVGLSSVLLLATTLGVYERSTTPEKIYQGIMVTDNGKSTGNLIAWLNTGGTNWLTGISNAFIPRTKTGYYLQTTPSAQIEDDGGSLGIFGKAVALGNNIGSAFGAGYYGLSIGTNTGTAKFIDSRSTGNRVGLEYDYDGEDWDSYVANFNTGTMIPKYMLSRTLANLTNNYVPFYSGGLWYNSRIIQSGNTIKIGDIDNGASIDMQDNTGIYFSPDSLDTIFSIYPNGLSFLGDYSSMELSISGVIITSVNSGIALNSLSGVYVNNKLTVSGNVVVGTVVDIGTGTKNSMSVGKDNILNANYSLVVGQDNDIVGTGVYFSMLVGYAGVMSDTLYSVGLGYKPYINSKNNTFLFAGSTGPKSAYKDKTFIVYADGGMGVDTNDPKTTLDVNGMIKIGKLTTACSSTIAGTMKYSGSNFYGCNGSSRVQLDN